MSINAGDILTYDGTKWVNQPWVQGPFGIGTSSPACNLHIVGTANNTLKVESNNSVSTSIVLSNTASGGHAYEFYSTGPSNGLPAGVFGVYDENTSLTPLSVNGSNGFIGTMSGGQFTWGSGISSPASPDTGLARSSAGVVKVTNGSTGTGDFIANNITANSKLGIGVTPTSQLQVNGAIATAIAAKTAAYTLTANDSVITAGASGGAFTVTLPTAVGIAGRHYTVKKTDSSANAVTVATTSSQTIDGAATAVLSSQYQFVTVVSDGANWSIIAH